jgi:NADH dehydrogenase
MQKGRSLHVRRTRDNKAKQEYPAMVLVVGATGVLGGLIVRRLLQEQHPVRALVRPGTSHRSLEQAGAEIVFGDLKQPDTISRACRGMAAIVTTANSVSRSAPDTVNTVDLDGNATLIEAAAEEGVEQFLFVSVYGASAQSPAPFIRAKAKTEEKLKASGVPFTILAPAAFMESWIGGIVLGPVKAGRPVTIVGSGQKRHSFVAVNDVAALAVAAVGNPLALDRTLPFGGPEAHTFLDATEMCARILGRVIPVRHIAPGQPIPGLPESVAQIAAGLDAADSIVDAQDIAEEFDVQLTSLESWLEHALGNGA